MAILQKTTLGDSFIQQVLFESVLSIVLGTRTAVVDGTDNVPIPRTLQSSGGSKDSIISANTQYMLGTSLDSCVYYI